LRYYVYVHLIFSFVVVCFVLVLVISKLGPLASACWLSGRENSAAYFLSLGYFCSAWVLVQEAFGYQDRSAYRAEQYVAASREYLYYLLFHNPFSFVLLCFSSSVAADM